VTKGQRTQLYVMAFFVALTEFSYAIQPRYESWDAWTVYLWPVTSIIFAYWVEKRAVLNMRYARICDENSVIIERYEAMAESYLQQTELLVAALDEERAKNGHA